MQLAISGEDVVAEFKTSGLFDSNLSDVSQFGSFRFDRWSLQIWQEVNQTGSSYLTRPQFIMACLLVYEQANNTAVEKEAALDEYIAEALFAKASTRAQVNGHQHEFGIRPYPNLPEVSNSPTEKRQ